MRSDGVPDSRLVLQYYDATDDSANCGVKLDGTDAGYGAAFALYIVAWLFTLGSAVMLMLNGNAGEVAPN